MTPLQVKRGEIYKTRLTGSKLATLPDELMEKVDMALKNSLALL